MNDLEFLKSTLSYDAETGVFTRIKSVSGNKGKAGSIAGSQNGQGYWLINFKGKKVPAHRLAWLYVNGEYPSLYIDHINGNKIDNRLCNLRLADKSQNAHNHRKAHSQNKVGLLGVSKATKNRFKAQIMYDGKIHYIGLYKTPEEAHNAYIEKKREVHKGNTL